MPSLKNRRGAFAVLTGIMFLAMMAVAAMAVDFSRLWTYRNELQTAADAGALAGAVQLLPDRDETKATDSATAYAQANNKALTKTPQLDTLQVGNWDPIAKTFTPNLTPHNAVHVVVGYPTVGLIAQVIGLAPPRVKARATAFASAPVGNNECMKPWALPYIVMMRRIMDARHGPGQYPVDSLTKPFEPDDLEELMEMSEAEREFTLKLGPQTATDSGGYSAGNYYAVQLPKYYDAATDTYPAETGPNDPTAGGDVYRDNIAGLTCHSLAIGDTVKSQTGVLAGPTVQGVAGQGQDSGLCATYNEATGLCYDDEGNLGVTAPASFFLCMTGCNGAARFEVKMIGSFTLLEVGGTGGQYKGTLQGAELRGRFNPIQASGPTTSTSSTQVKVVLVR